MAENSKIEWCDATFNPWIGCQKVSPGCDHCYAEALMDTRWGKVQWGPHGERKRTSDANWQLPFRWAKQARVAGKRPRVFCASLADWLDNQVPQQWRADLVKVIEQTSELDWLLLTKRPENYLKLAPFHWVQHGAPPNVWIGTTAEDDQRFVMRYKHLSKIAARVRFISYEPAIGPLQYPLPPIDWIICGGESGHGARMMDPQWARDLRDHCGEWSIPFFMKQVGSRSNLHGITGKGDNPDQWPADLRIREFPQ